MKKFIFIFLSIFATSILVAQAYERNHDSAKSADYTKVMTFNIRYNNPGDGINKWDKRKEDVINTILKNEIDILGIQEALHSQLMDLEKGLTDYEWIGVGRDDGIEKGEYAPIFYNKTRFSEVGSGYFWLSEEPMIAGSLGWDAATVRIATWAKLKNLSNGKIIFVLNTHFDHVGDLARKESAELILQKTYAYTKKGNFPIIVTGDFNAEPSSEAIRILTNTQNPRHLTDTQSISPKNKGIKWSFHNFGKLKESERPRIDYIFVNKNITVLNHEVIEGKLDERRWISDHCPIIANLRY